MRRAVGRDLILLQMILLGALATPAPASATPTKDSRAMDILRQANAATQAAPAVAYDFEYIGGGISAGRFTGSARLRKGSGLDDASYWAKTRMATPPVGFDEFPKEFVLSSDGQSVFSLDPEKHVLETASVKVGSNHLRRAAVFVVLFQFLQPGPFQRELEMSEEVSYEGTAQVGGVECNRVRVVYKPEAGGGEARWCFGQEDHLPRKQTSLSVMNGHLSYFEFTMTAMRIEQPSAGDAFRLSAPAGFRVHNSDERSVAVGAKAPDWALKNPSGETVTLSSLRGQIVVMDFWVTWCPQCRVLMPEVQKMHQDYQGRPVKVLGINLWEPGDAVEHMKKHGYTYDVLLRGEPVADLYKIWWQPAMFVIGADGTVLYADNGRDRERNKNARAAIDAELAKIEKGKQHE